MKTKASDKRLAVLALPIALLTLACQHLDATEVQGCSPLGLDRSQLMALRTDGFSIDDADERNRFALELLPCLASPDPELRDGVAYKAYFVLLRSGSLDGATIKSLRDELIAVLEGPDDAAGFHRPFAALALAEVARVDRIAPLYSAKERAELVDAAAAYLREIDDYRGYDEQSGWRHAVAHTADLVIQLALNPAIDEGHLRTLVEAVATQVAPSGTHFYTYGEYERLARPVYYIADRGELSATFWKEWFGRLASPAPFEGWGDTFASQEGLALRHNTRTFAMTLHVLATAWESESTRLLAEGALEVIRAMN